MGKKKERQSDKLEDDVEAVENKASAKKVKKRKSIREQAEDEDERNKSSKTESKQRKKRNEHSSSRAEGETGKSESDVSINGAVPKPTAKKFLLASGISLPRERS